MHPMGCQTHQAGALAQGAGDLDDVAMLEVAQSAMDQLGGGARGAGTPVIAFDQGHTQAAQGGLIGGPGAADAPADDQQIVAVLSEAALVPLHHSASRLVSQAGRSVRRPSSARRRSRVSTACSLQV